MKIKITITGKDAQKALQELLSNVQYDNLQVKIRFQIGA